jgi:peptidoglycan/LPS O-acetylase OafA/YrhL
MMRLSSEEVARMPAALDRESSTRLDLLRFPLIVGVVFLHAYGTAVGVAGGDVGISEAGPAVRFVQELVSQGFARVAVPLFFLVSGYLFFAGVEWSRTRYVAKVRTRIRSMLVPYLFWNVLNLVVLWAAQSLPLSRPFMTGQRALVAGYGASDYLNALIGMDGMPVAGQFWFIRDLMILVVLAPAIYALCRRAAVVYLPAVLGCWLVGWWPLVLPASAGVLFFSVGAWAAIRGSTIFATDKYRGAIIAMYLPGAVAVALAQGQSWTRYGAKVVLVLGIAAALGATGYFLRSSRLTNSLVGLSSASFFVFAAHEPLLTVARKLAFRALDPTADWLILTLYVAIPVALVVVLVVIYRGLGRIAPAFLDQITGSRSAGHHPQAQRRD